MDTDPTIPTQGLPKSGLRTEVLPENDRFEVWRESILPLFEPVIDDLPSAEPFYARVEGFHLQHFLMGQTSFSGQRFRRTRTHCAGENAEHFLIQMYLEGEYRGHNGPQEVVGGFGDITVLDLSRPLETRTPSSRNLSLVVPRELLYTYVKGGFSPGTVLSAGSPLGKIVGNHLLSVWQALPSATLADTRVISEVLLGVLAGAFNARAGVADANSSMVERATVEAIRRYIDRNLESSKLTPAHLCEHFGCSRAQLYRLFQPLGGVAGYIREARLKRCLYELTRCGHGRKHIAAIGARWGFNNQSHFCRLFRETFGITPGEAFERGREESTCHARNVKGFEQRSDLPLFRDWLVKL